RYTGRYDLMHAHYLKAGNSRAAMLSALELLRQQRPRRHERLNKSKYLRRLDSLATQYAHLTETGEVAIEQYQYMESQTDATPEQKVQHINKSLNRWGAWKRMNILRQAYQELTALQLQARTMDDVLLPGRAVAICLENMRGLSDVTIRVYSTGLDGSTQLNPDLPADYRKMKAQLTPIEYATVRRHYAGRQPWQLFSDTVHLEPLPVGVYMVEMTSMPATESPVRRLLFVSDLTTLRHAMPDGSLRFAVVSATTGQPVQGAKLDLMLPRGRRTLLTTLTTDKNGEASYKAAQRQYVEAWAHTAADRAMQPQGAFGSFYNPGQRLGTEHTQLFTDRAIYRPGQLVQVAAICYRNTDGVNNEALRGRQLTLTLRDANWQETATQEVTTDSFGTAAATFTLPKQTLPGQFTIQTAGGSVSFRVEEYKRPTFEVSLPEVNRRYAAGDTLALSGKAMSYSGVPVGSAKVRYTVVRRPALWWWWRMNSVDEEVNADETVTDADGAFSIEMPLELPDEALDADGRPTRRAMFYNFVARVQVTDAAGETHSAELTVPLGTRPTAFGCDMESQVLADQMKPVTFHLRNAAGQEVQTSVRWQLDGGPTSTCQTQQPVDIGQGRLLASGVHTLTAYCEQDTLQQEFVVFALADKRPAATTHDWFFQQAEQWTDNRQPLTVQVGSSDSCVHILYNIISGDRLIESGRADLTNELINRQFTYKEEYGSGLLLTYAWVKNGRVYHHEAQLKRPVPDRRLKLAWSTFRDRLTPGQQETWTLAVTPADTTCHASAQLMATLYDKSLDQLLRHRWQFTPYQSIPIPTATWAFADPAPIHFFGYRTGKALQWDELDFSHFDTDLLPRVYMGRFGAVRIRGARIGSNMLMAKQASANAVMADVEESMDAVAASNAKGMFTAEARLADETADSGRTDETVPDVQLRENMQETAFFYPQLATDSLTGQVNISFRLPESLTTWRFMALAHTAELCYGQTEAEAVAQKELMITPNVPRFLRQGDRATIAARVTNMTARHISATATLQLLDPETEAVLMQQRCRVAVAADTTVAVSWQIDALPERHSLLIVRTSVEAGNMSDGEQHYMPLLPQAERVTATMPFLLTGQGRHDIDIASLLPDDKNRKKGGQHGKPLFSQIEYTPSPAWIVMQALPTVSAPQADNAISQATALYANMLGQHIAMSTPGMKRAVQLWSQEQGSETTLDAQLEKNQQLRDMVLQETPWLADAKNEAQQRRQLVAFFDAGTMQTRVTQALDRMEKLQLPSGAWSWWQGMDGSYRITVEVCKLLARLADMNAADSTAKDNAARIDAMFGKAIGYLGRQTTDMVSRMKADERKGHKQTFPGLTALEWLYICSLNTDVYIDGTAAEANRYLVGLLQKETKNQTIYEKALTAIVLQRHAPALARQYAESLRQYTVSSPELGRYYDTPRASYSWQDYRIPTQTAAIEALHKLTPADSVTLREMQQWLLHEKRTQAWQTPIASVNAIHAMLLGANYPPVATEGTTATGAAQAAAMSGYQKRPLTTKELEQKSVTVEKTTAGTSWGAVYAQYWLPLDQMTDQKSGISVKREITGRMAVGQKVRVRLTITLKRDMDFVEVIDRRAACMEPVQQISGYKDGAYQVQRDCSACYYFDRMAKGRHIIETEYYIDRPGTYQLGSCSVQCAYAPEFRGTAKPITIVSEER
nr:alpha-2-macroglobulin [Prevotella sp.]